MKIDVSDDYESIAAEYQYAMIEILDGVLKRNDVPEEQRKTICSEFAFDFGMLHDQGEVKFGGRQLEPMVAFLEDQILRVQNGAFEFHEYAFGNAHEYFEGG